MADDTPIHGEEAIIAEFLAPLAAGYPGAFGLKDDCAAITPTPGHDLVVKTDPVAAGVHFLAGEAPEHIGWKALAVNVSDLAAKAAVPRAYLMALSFPEAPTRDWMRRFADGLAEAQVAFGMHLVGGDTDRRPGPVTVSITVFGEVPTGCMVRRGTARAGDILFVSGEIGAAGAGLALLRRPELAVGMSASGRDALIGRHCRPQPRLGLRAALLATACAAMDISDGLMKDLGRMARASGCGARIELARLPLPAALTASPRCGDLWERLAPVAGDDYELLVAVAPGDASRFERRAADAGVSVTRIGEMTGDPEVALIGRDGRPLVLPDSGWDHFA